MNARNDSIASNLLPLLRAFAMRPRHWIVLARNLVPVLGVIALGWSGRVTVFNYWVDGVWMLALLVAALMIRGLAMVHAQKPQYGFVNLFFQGLIGFALYFGLGAAPFWIIYGKLQLDGALWEVSQSRDLAMCTVSIVVGGLVAAFQRGGYFGMTLDEFKQRANVELQLLIARGIAMVVVASWTGGVGLVPLFALVFTAFEVGPQVAKDVAPTVALRED